MSIMICASRFDRIACLYQLLPSRTSDLPVIAYFLGIAVRMFFNDHDRRIFTFAIKASVPASASPTVRSSMAGYRRPSRAW
jgi:hypothetical protein